jgi:hypothetical protein
MDKTKRFLNARFSPEVLRRVVDSLPKHDSKSGVETDYLLVQVGDETWTHDSFDEFLSDYRKCTGRAVLEVAFGKSRKLRIESREAYDVSEVVVTDVSVRSPLRGEIEATFSIFEDHLLESQLPISPAPRKPAPTIFIGHGGNPQWRDLKDHLHDKHGFKIQAYEIGARAGHAIRDTLNEMLGSSSFAILVMTGEDDVADGGIRARQNVVHEAGLFQGRLGFARAIVLLEKGVQEFSNIHGIDQIRFEKDRIKETFGEVVATIRREFPNS